MEWPSGVSAPAAAQGLNLETEPLPRLIDKMDENSRPYEPVVPVLLSGYYDMTRKMQPKGSCALIARAALNGEQNSMAP